MAVILLLTTAAMVTQCDIVNVNYDFEDFLYDPRDIQKTKSTELTKPETQSKEIVTDAARDFRVRRQVLKDYGNKTRIWPSLVYYTFYTSAFRPYCEKMFKMGAKVWSDNTCIDFVENKSATDKVVVHKGYGSMSAIGRQGGDQLLILHENPTEGAAVHEIGHVLGFYHTMSRFDRDNYIKILAQNIDPRNINEFVKVGSNYTDTFGLTYDYGSVMHYGELSCSINQQPTMIAIDPHHQNTMGSDLISFSDIFMINERYGCNEKCRKSTSAKCENEGFPHPRNCSTCICPSGYGGTLCNQRPPGCGGDLDAISAEKMVYSKLGFGSDYRDQFDFCNYMITAPFGKKIEVKITSISPLYNTNGCKKGGVEIKAQDDQKLTGCRFCSVKGSENPIVSTSHRLPVILYNRVGMMRTIFTYRYID